MTNAGIKEAPIFQPIYRLSFDSGPCITRPTGVIETRIGGSFLVYDPPGTDYWKRYAEEHGDAQQA